MAINLYISRIILNLLGVDDYGIYNVVGGFVTMFTLLSGSLSNAISRFITFELGQSNFDRLKMVFSTSVNVQILISVIIGLLLEIVGIWFLNNKMQIPDGRLLAANVVLQCSVFTFIINLISIPYNSAIIAHEKMSAFAYISIADALLKLISALLLYLQFNDKLIAYSIFIAISATIIRFIYGFYCGRNFEECRYARLLDRSLLKEMMSLASWNMLGSGASVLNNQGVNVLINIFFGVATNAARGIAVQVNGAVMQFATSFTTALNPQITKNYAKGDFQQMKNLVYKGARFSYYLLLMAALPIIVETPFILKLWLGVVPEFTILFVRCTLVTSLISVLTTPLFTVSMATGEIKKYQTVVGILALMIFSLSYIAYNIGAGVEYTYYIAIFIEIAILFARLIIVNRQVEIGIKMFMKNVLARAMCVTVISTIIPVTLIYYVQASIVNNLLIIASSIISVVLFSFLVGMNRNERNSIIQLLKNKVLRR